MMRQHFARFVRLIGFIPILWASTAQADFSELLRRVPRDANALVMIQADKIFSSPMATELGWKMGLHAATAEQPLIVPEQTRRLVVGTQFNLASMEPIWEFAVLDMEKVPPMKVITDLDGGYIDDFGGTEAAWTPLNTYFVRFSDHLVGAIFPADRHRIARWVERGKRAKANSLHSYLKHGATIAEKGADIVMVLDLKHVLSPPKVAYVIEDFAAVAGKEDKLESLSKVVASVRGITLRVDVGKESQGKITIHFNDDASILKDVAKPVLLEILDRRGATIDDLAEWKTTMTSSGKAVILKGKLSIQGMRKLLSMTELPMPSSDASKARQESKGDESVDAAAKASLKYFKAMSTLLTDLRKSRKGSTLGHTDGVWIGRYARKIYRLPILNVDEDLQNYGAEVAGRLLEAVDVIEENRLQAKADMAAIHGGGKRYGGTNYGHSFGYRGGRYSDVNAAQQANRNRNEARMADRLKRTNERKRIRTEALARGTVAGRQIIDGLRDLTLSIRKQMTNRYGVEF